MNLSIKGISKGKDNRIFNIKIKKVFKFKQMKNILLVLSCVLLIKGMKAQNLQSYKDEKTGKYGYKDDNGKIIVTPIYDTTKPFEDGIAVVGKRVTYYDYKYGLINKMGKLIVEIKYTSVYTANGFIVVEDNLKGFPKSGFIDKTGKMITPIKFDYVGDISSNMARVGIGNLYGYIDKAGKEIIPVKYETIYSADNGIIITEKDDKPILVKTGKESPLNFEKVGFEAFGRLLVEQNNKFGFINTRGDVVIPLKYDEAWGFSEWERTGYLSNVKLGNKSGFIDTSGKEVIPLKYDLVGLFREGLAKVTTDMMPAVDSKNGYIDSAGNLVVPMIYNGAGYFSEGLAAVSKKSGGRNYTYGYINKNGKEIIPFIYESAEEFSGGLAAVRKNGKYGFIDSEGKEVIAFKYDRVHKNFSKGGSAWDTAEVELNGKKIRINKTGKEY